MSKRHLLMIIAACEVALVGIDVWLLATDRRPIG